MSQMLTRLFVTPAEAAAGGKERGDVPGWVLITLMTAGLVAALLAVAGPSSSRSSRGPWTQSPTSDDARDQCRWWHQR